jgi:MurNAc alpha-1-phosphate uridylyltransferase
MNPVPIQAFVLAAGYGTRMKPLTDTLPKPLVKLQGRPLLDYVLDHLKKSGVSRIVVNLHHHAEVLQKFLSSRSDLVLVPSYEEILLETGGGVKKALPLLGEDPFYMINGDAFWTDGPSGNALLALAKAFDSEKMDVLLLLIPLERMILTEGVGDYDLLPDGRLRRSLNKSGKFMFTGIRISHPRALRDTPEGPFSFLQVMDRAEREGRLFGLVHDGVWHHISTPNDLRRVEEDGNKTS